VQWQPAVHRERPARSVNATLKLMSKSLPVCAHRIYGSIVIVNYYSRLLQPIRRQAIPHEPGQHRAAQRRRRVADMFTHSVCGFQSISAGQHLHGRIAGPPPTQDQSSDLRTFLPAYWGID